MTQERVRQTSTNRVITNPTNYYALLGLHVGATSIEIRRAYRKLSKRYHPDTTDLPNQTATSKFQELNEAYATLSNPERRILYDQKIAYSRFKVSQAPSDFNHPVNQRPKTYSNSAYLDPTERPLSAGELFVLFILGLTFLGCLVLAIAIGLTRGESAVQFSNTTSYVPPITEPLRTTVTLESQLLSNHQFYHIGLINHNKTSPRLRVSANYGYSSEHDITEPQPLKLRNFFAPAV